MFAAALVLAATRRARLPQHGALAAGSDPVMRTFRVWMIANVVGTIVVAPLVITWSGFRPKRSGGLTMTEFVAGAVVCVLFFGTLQLVFGASADARLGGIGGRGPTYLPIMFMALIALLWGARGATLVAFAATLLALFHTLHGRGPFANIGACSGIRSSRCRVTRPRWRSRDFWSPDSKRRTGMRCGRRAIGGRASRRRSARIG